MVEIVKKGTPPEEQTFEAECRRCGTVVAFGYAEARHHPGGRASDPHLAVDCPVCSRVITKSIGW